jgi:two-component system alkaline phosphatase synthesis response regulator PhoP
MNDKPWIVLVEDDSVIAELIEYNLTSEGYALQSYRNGSAMFDALPGLDGICLFILDIMLPGMDGFEICRKIRASGSYPLVPIIMLTARGTESDKVKGLDAGADDYLTKPFGIREFLARVHAQVRRYNTSMEMQSGLGVTGDSAASAGGLSGSLDQPDRSTANTGILDSSGIILDDVRHRVFSGGKEVEMTNREYELLKFLMTHRGVAYSRDDLLNHVWGYEYSGETRTVDVHIRQLRRKIEKDDANPVIIETVRGRGYRFCENI